MNEKRYSECHANISTGHLVFKNGKVVLLEFQNLRRRRFESELINSLTFWNWNPKYCSVIFLRKMKIDIFVNSVCYLILLPFLISAVPTTHKNLSEMPIHRGSVKTIIDKSQICSVFHTKMTSKSNLLIIKSRFPAFFTQCKLVIPDSIKQQSMTTTCKRFNWKSRSLYC